eukprot:CAMPEP_0196651728 /NCGR_PEP_ID=MMETSP1086-20130531/819_1 /TAXON_ID=77921 /ORGANISM="Cyanoptyche  gloeocystis , Strain SAG4.97" /LENGTH=34 /DNA_ID= /DNA_START= /DNA_END= /DNA_ORIENTATION=
MRKLEAGKFSYIKNRCAGVVCKRSILVQTDSAPD